jgi:LemA protein
VTLEKLGDADNGTRRKGRMSMLYIALIVAICVLVWGGFALNGLIRSRNRVDEAWGDVDAQLQRRRDLVPNLVETVRAYAEHEQAVLGELTEARAVAMSVSSCGRKEVAEKDLTHAITEVAALVEQYPDQRASEGFRRFRSQLTEAELEIQAARRIYNSNVQRYNARIQSFPTSLVAGFGAFRPRRFFELALVPRREPHEIPVAV